jgi:hypothetical protein
VRERLFVGVMLISSGSGRKSEIEKSQMTSAVARRTRESPLLDMDARNCTSLRGPWLVVAANRQDCALSRPAVLRSTVFPARRSQ